MTILRKLLHVQNLLHLIALQFMDVVKLWMWSKHAVLKRELSLTNRSKYHSSSGKWWQVMKSDYIRSCFLPEHQPSPPSCASHFKSRAPSHSGSSYFCDCGRKKNMEFALFVVIVQLL